MSAVASRQPQNILLTSSSPLGDIKIVDFGLSRMVCSHQELREIMGTPEYVGELVLSHTSINTVFTLIQFCVITSMFMFFFPAPEILNYEPISTATDMW